MMNLIEQLQKNAGFRDDYHFCTDGKTIGYGRNVDNNPFTPNEILMLGREDFDNEPMTRDEAEDLLVNDVNKATASIKEYFPWSQLSPARKAVLVNMVIDMGITGLLKFKKMSRAIELQYYEKAAVEMLLSAWAKKEGLRAEQLIKQMYTGDWEQAVEYKPREIRL
ncbi:MAG TPA: glycoside hydrolase [Methylococcaceae bacterium]|nr:glycoside hydrolase [Methylococcaceae bacterium]